MKVTGWTYWEDDRYEEIPIDKYDEARRIVAREMRERGYKFTGNYHQNGDFGVPVIDEKWLLTMTQRSWGHMMVEAYPDKIDDTDGYGYCKWAWVAPEEMVIPKEGE